MKSFAKCHSSYPSHDALGEVVAKLTNGRHVIVRLPNHIVMASNPDEFNTVVAAFMRNAERVRSNL